MQDERRLTRNLSPVGAWAFSIGTSIGWGSLVVTSSNYPAQAGSWGSAIGMVVGGLIMLLISASYAYLMNIYPDAGGAYTYAAEVLGHDYGFLTAWFLSLTYLAILWANATSMSVLIVNFRTISERAHSSELQLTAGREQARRDPLTGVNSRQAYAEKEKELDEQIAGGEAGEFGIVICDLNGLKFINDSLGLKAGDERFRQASQIICELFSHSPVYRNGGDEFVVWLSGRDFENRQAILDELRRRSEANIASGEVGISAGLSEYRKGEDIRVHPVFERADAAMYREKMRLKGLGAATR